jgi:hypothetical protein
MKWLPVAPEPVMALPVVGQAHPLRTRYRRFLNLSIAMAASLHLIAVSGWLLRREADPVQPRLDPIRFHFRDFGVPPSLLSKDAVNPQVEIAKQVAPPPVGIPEPVKDHLAINETIGDKLDIIDALEPAQAGES